MKVQTNAIRRIELSHALISSTAIMGWSGCASIVSRSGVKIRIQKLKYDLATRHACGNVHTPVVI